MQPRSMVCFSSCLQVPVQFEFLLWLPSVDNDSGCISQISPLLSKLLLVKAFHHSNSKSKTLHNTHMFTVIIFVVMPRHFIR